MTEREVSEENIAPWYRQPWAWFVLTPLIVVVIVSSITVTIAVKNADETVIDNYYKEGRMINQRLEQDHRADQLGMQAKLRFDLLVGEVFVELTGSDTPQSLVLEFSHPTSEDKDFSVSLVETASGQYRGDLLSAPQYFWYLRLFPNLTADSSVVDRNAAPWRLLGDIDFRQSTELTLAPRH